MSWVTVASVAVSAYGAYQSSKQQKKAAEQAGQTVSESSKEAIELQKRLYERGVELQEPFRNRLISSIDTLQGLAGSYGGGLSPLGKIEQREGEKAIKRIAASRGLGGSGAELELLGKFNERLIAGETDKMFGRYATIAQLANPGQLGYISPSVQTGGNLANLALTGGFGKANAQLQAGQAQGSFYSGLGGLGGQLGGMDWGSVFGGGGGTTGGGGTALSYGGGGTNYNTYSDYGGSTFV